MAEYQSIVCVCVYMYTPLFFIPSSVSGLLGCFHISITVNNAVMNIGVHVSFQMSVFLSLAYVLQSGFTGLCNSSGFNVWEISRLFSIAAAPIHVPTNCAPGLPVLSASLPTFVICRLFEANYSDRCEVVSHCGSDLRFSDDWWCGISFHEPVGHLCVLSGETSVRVHCDAPYYLQFTLILIHPNPFTKQLPGHILGSLPNTVSLSLSFFFL